MPQPLDVEDVRLDWARYVLNELSLDAQWDIGSSKAIEIGHSDISHIQSNQHKVELYTKY